MFYKLEKAKKRLRGGRFGESKSVGVSIKIYTCNGKILNDYIMNVFTGNLLREHMDVKS